MKLRVVELLLVSTLPAMVLAQRGIPDVILTVATLIGGTLAAGSANAFNQIMEQDLDAAMGRTAKRPLVLGTISTRAAFFFASFIGTLSLVIFWIFTNPLATLLTFIAIVFYVGVYTALLKRRTSQNIVWGGIAGCMPVLIGWAAVADNLSWSALLLFLVIFFWTPPHFWALAIKYNDDYSRAMVPMLPVVASERIVTRQMIGYTLAMVGSSVALGVVAELPVWYYVVALLVGGCFIFLVIGLHSKEERDRSKLAERIFHGSITYLSVISLIIVVASLV
jgi:protoheme IX farnesyltransferase